MAAVELQRDAEGAALATLRKNDDDEKRFKDIVCLNSPKTE